MVYDPYSHAGDIRLISRQWTCVVHDHVMQIHRWKKRK